jgi:hypothetical protein
MVSPDPSNSWVCRGLSSPHVNQMPEPDPYDVEILVNYERAVRRTNERRGLRPRLQVVAIGG